MDIFPSLVALAVIAFFAVVTVLLILIAGKLSALARRIDALERRERAQPVPGSQPVPQAPIAAPAPVAQPVHVAPPAPVLPPPPRPEPIAAPRMTPLALPAPIAPKPKVNWERWLGVRGAAVLGGIFLAVAGVLFFQYSIERGLITPEMRVVFGLFAGIVALGGGQFTRKKGYAITGNAITGAGAVILYAAFWGAKQFDILSVIVCFAAMGGVTALTCFLSYRHGSQLIAWLGLTGGFATPLLLSTGADQPIGLFAYVLVLDLGFLFVASQRRWPLLGLWGLVGTALIEALWVGMKMDVAEYPIALIVLALFALVFVIASSRASQSDRGRWVVSQVGAVLVPFFFAFYFAARGDVGYHLWPLATLCGLLAIATCWLARVQGAALLPGGAAAGSSAIALIWILSHELEGARVWELTCCALALCAVFWLATEWKRAKLSPEVALGADSALAVALGGFLVAGFAASAHSAHVELWPFLALFTGLGLGFTRSGAHPRMHASAFVAAPAIVFGMLWWTWSHAGEGTALGLQEIWMLVIAACALVMLALWRIGGAGARAGNAGVAIAGVIGMVLVANVLGDAEAPDGFGARIVFLALAGVACFAATAADMVGLVALAALACAGFHGGAGELNHALDRTWSDLLLSALISMALLGAWIPLARRQWRGKGAWIVAALVPLFWVGHVWEAVVMLYGTGARAWIPVPFLVMECAAAALAWRRSARTGALLCALVAIVCASAILPLWVDREVIVTWSAISCAGLALLWKQSRFEPALVLIAASAVIAGFGGIFVDGVGSFERMDQLVWNEHARSYLLPAVLLVFAGTQVENALRITPLVCGLAMGLLWVTVEVHQAYATGERFQLFFPRTEARELTVSIAWALYALGMLAVGMARKTISLRWASLILLVAVIGKVFLLDLADLRGLYRVGSFLGLAVSLLLVSFAYQRFVFGKKSGVEGEIA